jgi:hypothetical protein
LQLRDNQFMVIDRLAPSVATLYAELLEQGLIYERVAGMEAEYPGGPVSKVVRGRRYLYWQIRKGDQAAQRYLGPDTAELRDALERLNERRRETAEPRASLDRLAAMLIHGGAAREESRVAAVLRLLADLGLFRRGAVLAGTQAFRAYGNLLSVRLPSTALRTQDIDVAQSIDVALAASVEPPVPVESSLASLGRLPVPGLDPRNPSTSFHLRGRELRVDFLTPARRGGAEGPIPIPGLGLSAWPAVPRAIIEEPVADGPRLSPVLSAIQVFALTVGDCRDQNGLEQAGGRIEPGANPACALAPTGLTTCARRLGAEGSCLAPMRREAQRAPEFDR